MFSHVTLGTNDLEKARTFYDAIFTAIGASPGALLPDNRRLVYQHKGGILIVTLPIDGKAATHANGGTIGFTMDDAEQVHAWHDAGAGAGGTSCEDPPGLRKEINLHLAYLRDPDGNKLCAMYRPH